MQNELRTALVQTDLIWENPEQNKQQLAAKIKGLTGKADLVILPEMFTSGFTMSPEAVAETMEGETVAWMKQMAAKTSAAICGSVVITDNGHYFNRFVFAMPDGSLETYDKRHTFTLAGEHEVYKAGSEKRIIHYKGWAICPLICYDLRFPVWARNTEDYDLLIYVANWPKPRIAAWDALLKARAIENMSYCIGVNRVGFDGNDYEYPGHSAVYDGLGSNMSNLKPGQEAIETITLDKMHLEAIRRRLKFLDDRDAFTVVM